MWHHVVEHGEAITFRHCRMSTGGLAIAGSASDIGILCGACVTSPLRHPNSAVTTAVVVKAYQGMGMDPGDGGGCASQGCDLCHSTASNPHIIAVFC